ncbi:discoidin domain-containing protein [Desulfobacterales bacterium HSG2]|nr:discoidin domain-containing protein [Desulfobacterales bacterium HSG2]
MISIALKLDKKESRLDLIPSSVEWNSQNVGAQYGFFNDTKLDSPFEELFIKRRESRKAPGHELLLSYHQKGIVPHTPPFLGYESNNNHHYYVLSKLNRLVTLDRYTKSNKTSHHLVVNREFVQNCLATLILTLSVINERGFYYTDFDYKNIMCNFADNKVVLIDVDSCVRLNYPARKVQGWSVSFKWWNLYMARNMSDSPVALNQTMIISFALIWCKALIQIETGSQTNVSHILEAKIEDQKMLFDIFEKEDERAFKKTYNTPKKYDKQISRLFSNWHRIFDKMNSGRPVEWKEISRFVYQLLSLSGEEPDSSLSQTFRSLFQRISQLSLSAIADVFRLPFQGIRQLGSRIADALFQRIRQLGSRIADAFRPLFQRVRQLGSHIADAFRLLFQRIVQFVLLLWEMILCIVGDIVPLAVIALFLILVYESGNISQFVRVNHISASASSSLSPDNNAHIPRNITDGLEHTAWIEDVKGHGIGEWIQLEFRKKKSICRIGIMNGYNKKKSDMSGDRFYRNGRVKSATLSFSDGFLKKIDLADKRSMQFITLEPPVATLYLRLTINSAYPNCEFQNTAISEIKIWACN